MLAPVERYGSVTFFKIGDSAIRDITDTPVVFLGKADAKLAAEVMTWFRLGCKVVQATSNHPPLEASQYAQALVDQLNTLARSREIYDASEAEPTDGGSKSVIEFTCREDR